MLSGMGVASVDYLDYRITAVPGTYCSVMARSGLCVLANLLRRSDARPSQSVGQSVSVKIQYCMRANARHPQRVEIC